MSFPQLSIQTFVRKVINKSLLAQRFKLRIFTCNVRNEFIDWLKIHNKTHSYVFAIVLKKTMQIPFHGKQRREKEPGSTIKMQQKDHLLPGTNPCLCAWDYSVQVVCY